MTTIPLIHVDAIHPSLTSWFSSRRSTIGSDFPWLRFEQSHWQWKSLGIFILWTYCVQSVVINWHPTHVSLVWLNTNSEMWYAWSWERKRLSKPKVISQECKKIGVLIPKINNQVTKNCAYCTHKSSTASYYIERSWQFRRQWCLTTRRRRKYAYMS